MRDLIKPIAFGLFLTNSLADAEMCFRFRTPQDRPSQASRPSPVGLSVASLPIAAGTPWLAKSDQLWDAVYFRRVERTLRAQCLSVLAQRQDTNLPSYIEQQLAQHLSMGSSQDREWRDLLLYTTERTQFVEPKLRDKVQTLLLQHALSLRDQGGAAAQKPLWAALRRYATLIPAEEVNSLFEFLRDEDAPLTKQAALQSIQTVFSVVPPDVNLNLKSIRAHAHRLALALLMPQNASHSETRTLALNAFWAACLLDDPQISELLAALIAMQKPHMLWLSRDQLKAVADAWTKHSEANSDSGKAHERLFSTIQVLEQSLANTQPNQGSNV